MRSSGSQTGTVGCRLVYEHCIAFFKPLYLKLDLEPSTVFDTPEKQAVLEPVTEIDKLTTILEYPDIGQPYDPLLRLFEMNEYAHSFEMAFAPQDRILELNTWKDGYAIRLTVEGRNNKYMKKEDFYEFMPPTNIREKIAQLTAMYPRVRGRAIDEIPNEEGVCFRQGFLAGPLMEQEYIDMVFVLRGKPDVMLNTGASIAIENVSFVEEAKKSQAGNEYMAEEKGGKYEVLRLGLGQSAHGVGFEERITEEPLTNDSIVITGNGFTLWTAYTETDGRPQSDFSAALYNGQREEDRRDAVTRMNEFLPNIDKASFSTAQIIALWDAMTATIRPNTGKTTLSPLKVATEAKPAKHPMQGRRFTSGDVCPCDADYRPFPYAEHEEVLESKRHIKKGEVFPEMMVRHTKPREVIIKTGLFSKKTEQEFDYLGKVVWRLHPDEIDNYRG